jgi:hypothetical protein
VRRGRSEIRRRRPPPTGHHPGEQRGGGGRKLENGIPLAPDSMEGREDQSERLDLGERDEPGGEQEGGQRGRRDGRSDEQRRRNDDRPQRDEDDRVSRSDRSASAKVLVRLHVEPHCEERELRA